MKIRNDFVTNSSSSSFIIALCYINNEQLESVKNYMREVLDYSDEDIDDYCITEKYITFSSYDTDSISVLSESIGIPEDVILKIDY